MFNINIVIHSSCWMSRKMSDGSSIWAAIVILNASFYPAVLDAVIWLHIASGFFLTMWPINAIFFDKKCLCVSVLLSISFCTVGSHYLLAHFSEQSVSLNLIHFLVSCLIALQLILFWFALTGLITICTLFGFHSCPWLWNPNKEGADSPCILMELSRTEKGFSQSLSFLPVILPFRCIWATVMGTLRTLTSSSHSIAHFSSLFAAMCLAVGLRVCAPSFRQSIWGFFGWYSPDLTRAQQ